MQACMGTGVCVYIYIYYKHIHAYKHSAVHVPHVPVGTVVSHHANNFKHALSRYKTVYIYIYICYIYRVVPIHACTYTYTGMQRMYIYIYMCICIPMCMHLVYSSQPIKFGFPAIKGIGRDFPYSLNSMMWTVATLLAKVGS